MSRKFGGRLIRIMMTKSSSCDILKKKRTIRRGSGSRPKGSYLMDLRFWNYVIPDGSTTQRKRNPRLMAFWNYVIPDGSTTYIVSIQRARLFWNYVIPDGSTTPCHSSRNSLRFWNYVIPDGSTTIAAATGYIGQFWNYVIPDGSTTHERLQPADARFGTMSFQMVLLLFMVLVLLSWVLELCHSRWFYYLLHQRSLLIGVLELCHSRWFYYTAVAQHTLTIVLELCHSRWFYYISGRCFG